MAVEKGSARNSSLAESLASGVTLYHADCFDVIANMPDASVDVVITDPPWGKKTHDGARTGTGDTVLLPEAETFSAITENDFVRISRELVRVSRRWVLMTFEWRYAATLEQSMPDEFIRLGIWIKPNAAPQFSGDRPGTGWEPVVLLHRKGKKRWNGGGHHGIWTHNIQQEKSHPTQKPHALVRRWVQQFSDPGETILDPFAGSGTTAIAAMQEGRNCVLIERDTDYCDTIRRRVLKADGREPGTFFCDL